MTEIAAKSNLEHTVNEFNKLSIQVSLNGLSFCVLDTVDKSILTSEHIVFKKEHNPYQLLEAFKLLFEKHHLHQKEFSEIIVAHRNNLFSLVPKPLFDENEMANYLKFNTKILANDHIAYDTIENYDIINVFVPFVNINNYIYDIFGEFNYTHSGTVMIHSLLGSKTDTKNPTCYIHIMENEFEITVISQKKLLLYNSFKYTTKEDFIYYILFTLEQMQLDTETIKLMLFGAVKENDSLFNICYEYIKDISLFTPPYTLYPMTNEKDGIDFKALNS